MHFILPWKDPSAVVLKLVTKAEQWRQIPFCITKFDFLGQWSGCWSVRNGMPPSLPKIVTSYFLLNKLLIPMKTFDRINVPRTLFPFLFSPFRRKQFFSSIWVIRWLSHTNPNHHKQRKWVLSNLIYRYWSDLLSFLLFPKFQAPISLSLFQQGIELLPVLLDVTRSSILKLL